MKTPSLAAPALAAAVLAGCAQAPKKSPPQDAFAEALTPVISCPIPAMYALYAFSGSEPPEEARRMRLENYAHAYMSARDLRRSLKCLEEHPDPSQPHERADTEKWLAESQKNLDAEQAGVPEDERIADAWEDYVHADSAHAKTILTVIRRNGKKELVEHAFDVP